MARPTILLLLIAVLVVGCGNRSGAAAELDRHIAALPGVADTAMRYEKTLERGEIFELTVTLAPDVTSEQAQRVARTYVAGLADENYTGGNYVIMTLVTPKFTLPITALSDDGTVDSAQETADQVARTYAAAASPAVDNLSIGDGLRPTRISLRQPIDDAAVADFRRAHPELDHPETAWTLRAPLGTDHVNRDFTSIGVLPDPAIARIWPQVVDAVGVENSVSGTFTPDRGTTVEVRQGLGAPQDTAELIGKIAPLLAQLDRPVQVTGETGSPRESIEVTIGGCYRHGDRHQETPAERDLALRYERC